MTSSPLDLTRPLALADGTPLTNVRAKIIYAGVGDVPGFVADAPTANKSQRGRVFRADGFSPSGTGNATYANPGGPLSLPDEDAARREFPMFDGLMAYFPNALAYVAMVSKIGNEQHNAGQPLHWARGKSTDHENKIMRHLADVGRKDGRGVRHSGSLAWRALANLQEELEREEGAPMSRGSRPPA